MVNADRECCEANCTAPVYARDRCTAHYNKERHKTYVYPQKPCTWPRCPTVGRVTLNLCPRHYRRVRKARNEGRPCKEKGCPQPLYANGLCEKHYVRQNRKGDTADPPPPAERFVLSDGYVMVADPSRPGKFIREHRLVVSRLIGRPLRRRETVHHRNGVRSDNRSENLELWTKDHPTGSRIRDLVEWATRFIKDHHSVVRMLE